MNGCLVSGLFMIHLSHNDLVISYSQLTVDEPAVQGVMPDITQRMPGPHVRVVQLSDLHFYENTSPSYYDRVHDHVVALQPDVIAMTGDLIHKGSRFIEPAAVFLASLHTSLPQSICLGVMGNHDYQDDAAGQLLQSAVEGAGFRLLINDAVALSGFQSKPAQGLSLNVVGFDDYYYGPRCRHQTRHQAAEVAKQKLDTLPRADFTLGLTHNPLQMDIINAVAPNRCNWVISGHTHAGHVWIPLLKPIYQHVFHHKYRYGWYSFGDTQLYVTSGVGSAAFYIKAFGFKTGLPRFRWNTNPEIAVFDMGLPTK